MTEIHCKELSNCPVLVQWFQSLCGESCNGFDMLIELAVLLSVVLETQSLASAQVLEDQEKVVEEMKKDASELGIEVIDQISALAG